MPSHMGVQKFATERNSQAEVLIDFILEKFALLLHQRNYITAAETPTRQEPFVRDDCSDVFDHFLQFEPANSISDLSGKVQLWCQTTCYKGNKLGRAESNKTYEIRETLVEALGLRRWLLQEGVSFRTVHFTIGPVSYTYGWFKSAKENAFDLSLYPDNTIDTEELFTELSRLFSGVTVEFEIYRRLEQEVKESRSQISRYFETTLQQLVEWAYSGFLSSTMANTQANLLTKIREDQSLSTSSALYSIHKGGENIKGRIQELLAGAETSDAALVRTLKHLNVKNPLLPIALEAELDWSAWCHRTFKIPLGIMQLSDYVRYLWNNRSDERLISRRLLLRIHSDEAIRYVQDVNIPGLTEHNLYNGSHSVTQVNSIVNLIVEHCTNQGLITPVELYSRLISDRGLQLLRASRKFEALNGTNLKPSFYYIEECLAAEFDVVTFRQTSLPLPVAYHASFSINGTEPYENMKVILKKGTKQPRAILKAKFFRRQEFPRRAKEEAYVGFTSKYVLQNGVFVARYPELPFVMFVDMAEIEPPDYAVRRLSTAGWDVFFSVDALLDFLRSK